MAFISILLATMLTYTTNAYLGIDAAGSTISTSSYKCLRNGGYDFVITRAWYSTGSFDTLSVGNLANAQAAGYSVRNTSVYMFPCSSTANSATTQMNTMISDLSSHGAKYNMIWLDIEDNPDSECSWSKNTIAVNCDIILALGTAAEANGKKVGIYSNHNEWGGYVFHGDYGACSQPAKEKNWPLWYADYDGAKNFNDFVAFGGWTKPVIKQYAGDAKVCGLDVDTNWEPTPASSRL
eukprot:UN01274